LLVYLVQPAVHHAKMNRVSFPWSTVITGAVAFAGIGYGAHLSAKRETLNWTRDQRLKAYVELLTAIERCYSAFQTLAAIMAVLDYPADVRDDAKASEAVEDWRKWYDEIDRCLTFAGLVGSERSIDNRVLIDHAWRSYQMALVIDVRQGTRTNREEWESVSRKTYGGERTLQNMLRVDLDRVNSFGQRMSDGLRRLRRKIRNPRAY
jgi:hypothetical protein